jgi:hypothetical protein
MERRIAILYGGPGPTTLRCVTRYPFVFNSHEICGEVPDIGQEKILWFLLLHIFEFQVASSEKKIRKFVHKYKDKLFSAVSIFPKSTPTYSIHTVLVLRPQTISIFAERDSLWRRKSHKSFLIFLIGPLTPLLFLKVFFAKSDSVMRWWPR